jgi:sec-independent protein translocase protein TatA
MPFGIGATEIIIVLVIVLLIFGPKRLPDLGRSMGRGMREFKDSVTGKDDERDELPTRSEESDEEAKTDAPPGQNEAATAGPKQS